MLEDRMWQEPTRLETTDCKAINSTTSTQRGQVVNQRVVIVMSVGGKVTIGMISKPMMKLTQKNMKFDWTKKAKVAFQLLKQKLCSVPILALPKGSENFMVYYDASHKGLGAVLMQKEC
ncbi:putative reverse transcriptase domain-containing protein [Tanacetum coccineum]